MPIGPALALVFGLCWSGPATACPPAVSGLLQGSEKAPTFRSAVELVSLTAVVRDHYGRMVKGLGPNDFEVYDAGVKRPVLGFAAAEDGPVSVAVLFDTSGSMRVSDGVRAGRIVVEHLLGQFRPGADEIAFYTFDHGLLELSAFTMDPEVVRRRLGDIDAFGSTALYDAVGQVASRVTARDARRRAVIVVTDGVDTSSHRSAAEVSAVASASDVPVYVVIVGPGEGPAPGLLGDLARWTGGALLKGHGPTAAATAAGQILAELRHQYLLAFESAGPGWRPVDVRLRRARLTVRTRSAYRG